MTACWRLPDGRLLVPARAKAEDGAVVRVGVMAIGPEHPDFEAWAKLSRREEDTTAEGYSYFRDRDGTLCREVARQREVWFPRTKKWSPYFWNADDVVPITPADVRAGWGAKALA